MNLRELCFHLRNRRRMYLHDDRFCTAVAFVDGYNAALDGVPLAGFDEYVETRTVGRSSSLHWSYLVASTKVPEVLHEHIALGDIPAEADVPLTDTLVDLLEAFSEAAPARTATASADPGAPPAK